MPSSFSSYAATSPFSSDGINLTAANTLANTGASSGLSRPTHASLDVERTFRKKPSAIQTGDSDSDSDSEDEVEVTSGPVRSSDSASGITDGPYSVAAVAVESRDARVKGISSNETVTSSVAIEEEINVERSLKDGDVRKKKSKPSARKAANLSGDSREDTKSRLPLTPNSLLISLFIPIPVFRTASLLQGSRGGRSGSAARARTT